jgi:lipid-binding SYLF domain-containing protein
MKTRRIAAPLTLTLLMLTLTLGAQPVVADERAQKLVDDALVTFENMIADPNMGWFRGSFPEARGLLLVPSLLKAGLIIGGSGGTGVLLIRDKSTNEWTAPAFYSMGTSSIGFQMGAQKSEVAVLVRSERAVNSLLTTSLKLGGDVSVAAGPVGAGVGGKVTADMVTFMRSRGAFGGVALDGAVIAVHKGLNKAYYGKEVSPVEILILREVDNDDAQALRDAFAKAIKR